MNKKRRGEGGRRRAYAMHGVLDGLDVVQTDGAVHEPLGVELGALCALERGRGVLQEDGSGDEVGDVDERVPHEHQSDPEPAEESEGAESPRRGARRPVGSGEGREGVGVGRLAEAGEEEGHEGGAVAEGVVNAEDGDGGGLGGGEVEDVELPHGAGGVHGGPAKGGHVVLQEAVRGGGVAAIGVQVRDHQVLLYLHVGPHPPRLLPLRLVQNLSRRELSVASWNTKLASKTSFVEPECCRSGGDGRASPGCRP